MKFSSIIDSLRAEVATILGADYQRLSYVHDVSKNDTRGIIKGYGVRGLSGSELDDLIGKNISIEQTYEIILTNDLITNGSTDVHIDNEVKSLQDNAQLIYEQIVYKKFNPNIILVSGLSLDEPEILEEDNGIVQRFSVTIRYRVQLT